MKKYIAYIFVLLLIFNLLGCSSNDVVQKNEFVEKIKKMETNRIKLNNLEINYSTFKENVTGIMSENYQENYFKKMDEEIIFGYDGKKFRGKDLENLSAEELNKHKENLKEFTQEYGLKPQEIILEISDGTYEGTFDEQKRAYSKESLVTRINPDTKDTMEALTFKAYDFEKEDEEWKIAGIKSSFLRLKGTEEEIQKMLEQTPYNKASNSAIEYIDVTAINFNEK